MDADEASRRNENKQEYIKETCKKMLDLKVNLNKKRKKVFWISKNYKKSMKKSKISTDKRNQMI